MDAIAALARRFPDHARRIRRLRAEDATFRAICEDCGEALRALAHWQAADPSAQQRAEEYGRLVKELEDEALAALKHARASRCETGEQKRRRWARRRTR